jgi:CheY-like chemotaxis protein
VPPGPAGRSILILDDEREVVEGVAEYLEKALPGLRVLRATSGPEALELLKGNKVDLILADYRMPGQSGLEVLVEAARTMPDVPRVMFTAYPDLDLAVDAVNQAKVRRFLVKPLHPQTLKDVVEQLLADPGDGRVGR